MESLLHSTPVSVFIDVNTETLHINPRGERDIVAAMTLSTCKSFELYARNHMVMSSKDVFNVLSSKNVVLSSSCLVEGKALETVRLAEGLPSRQQHRSRVNTDNNTVIMCPSAEMFPFLCVGDPWSWMGEPGASAAKGSQAPSQHIRYGKDWKSRVWKLIPEDQSVRGQHQRAAFSSLQHILWSEWPVPTEPPVWVSHQAEPSSKHLNSAIVSGAQVSPVQRRFSWWVDSNEKPREEGVCEDLLPVRRKRPVVAPSTHPLPPPAHLCI